MSNLLIRFAISTSRSGGLLKREEVTKKSKFRYVSPELRNVVSAAAQMRPRQFKKVLELADKKLQTTFAMRLQELSKDDNASGKSKSASGSRYILQSTLSSEYRLDPNLFPANVGDEREGLKVFVISLIFLSAGIVSEGLGILRRLMFLIA